MSASGLYNWKQSKTLSTIRPVIPGPTIRKINMVEDPFCVSHCEAFISIEKAEYVALSWSLLWILTLIKCFDMKCMLKRCSNISLEMTYLP